MIFFVLLADSMGWYRHWPPLCGLNSNFRAASLRRLWTVSCLYNHQVFYLIRARHAWWIQYQGVFRYFHVTCMCGVCSPRTDPVSCSGTSHPEIAELIAKRYSQPDVYALDLLLYLHWSELGYRFQRPPSHATTLAKVLYD